MTEAEPMGLIRGSGPTIAVFDRNVVAVYGVLDLMKGYEKK